jgi:serine/threonine protein kinase
MLVVDRSAIETSSKGVVSLAERTTPFKCNSFPKYSKNIFFSRARSGSWHGFILQIAFDKRDSAMHFSNPETRASLILRLPDAAEVAAWDSFESIYAPVIQRVALRQGLQPADVENVVQEVLLQVAKSIESPYLVMRYVAGESLQARVDRLGALDVCEILRIAMQSASGLAAAHSDPHELTYRVCEGYIEITSKAEAIKNPALRFYDLSYVVRDNSRLAEILNAIYTSVDPNSWEQNGGSCTCVPVGQILVVRTSETNHLEIERLLARLSVNQPPAAAAGKTEGST